MFSRRHWIPPGGLLFAQLCHGLSWLLLLWIAISGSIEAISPQALAWIHLVTLGWFTVAAFSILLHVVPGFTDLRWRFEGVARGSLGIFAAAVAVFTATLAVAPQFLGVPAALVLAALLAYVAAALATLAQGRSAERTERAIARALAITFLILVAVAALGMLLSLFLSGIVAAAWIARLPAAHANLGIYGWLSLLVFGVSARTIRPISGARPRSARAHVLTGTATLAGAVALSAGLGTGVAAVAWLGAILLGVGVLAYVVDIAGVLVRATNPHRPPQAFVAASLAWLLLALVLGALSLAGRPLGLAYGFAILIGWIGQMVNAHIFHIGTRVLATVYRGDDDETRPQELLDVLLEWSSFAFFQVAVAAVTYGLAADAPAFAVAGAAFGFAAWGIMLADLATARARARRVPETISLL
jgi:hypothetical protein